MHTYVIALAAFIAGYILQPQVTKLLAYLDAKEEADAKALDTEAKDEITNEVKKL